MAETLTSMEPESQPGELNADEQNSLEVGQQLAQEQETLLAGKYGSTEQLEQAYLELQQKLGAEDEGEPQEEEPGEESEEVQDEEQIEGGLTDEDIESLQDMAGGQQQYEQMLRAVWTACCLRSESKNERTSTLYSAMGRQSPRSISSRCSTA